MPLVVLLALVAALMGAVLLERQAAVFRLATREVRSYEDRHFERGVREVVGAWTDSLAGQPVETMIGDDGHVLDIELPGGGGAAVYMFDGQGGWLSDPGALPAMDREHWLGVVIELEKLGAGGGAGAPDGSWFRPVGPLAVSAQTAPRAVLEAIGNYMGGRGAGAQFAASIEKARSRGEPLTAADLATAMGAAGLGPKEREAAARLVTVMPELKAVIVDVYRASRRGGVELTRRYGGRLVLPGGTTRASSSMTSLQKFLSWEELPIEELN